MKIITVRGFGKYGKAHKKSRKGKKGALTAQQRRMAAAGRACAGRKLRDFRACVKSHLKK